MCTLCYSQEVVRNFQIPDFMKVDFEKGCKSKVIVFNRTGVEGVYESCDQSKACEVCFSEKTEKVRIVKECTNSSNSTIKEYELVENSVWRERQSINGKEKEQYIIVGKEVSERDTSEVFHPSTYESKLYITHYLKTELR